MKALMSIAPGGPRSLELREVPDPEPGMPLGSYKVRP